MNVFFFSLGCVTAAVVKAPVSIRWGRLLPLLQRDLLLPRLIRRWATFAEGPPAGSLLQVDAASAPIVTPRVTTQT